MEPTIPLITAGRFGLEQRCSYRHWDLYDEEVPEVDLDTAVSQLDLASGCAVRTFLLLGDQNAGKSTMLHSFCRDGDPRFMQLSSLLPVLSSSFLNTRLVPRTAVGVDLNQRVSAVRDEMPFMDTDIARGLVMLTLENFLFFCNEFNIPGYGVGPDAVNGAANLPPDFSDDARFVALQFVELGGDHLDRLLHFHASNGDLDAVRAVECSMPSSAHAGNGNDDPFWSDMHEVLLGSLKLLADTTCTVYFINCATLFPSNSLSQPALRPLLRKLRFLDSALARNGCGDAASSCEIIFYCSRTSHVDVTILDAQSSWCTAFSELVSYLQDELGDAAQSVIDLLPKDFPSNASIWEATDEELDLSPLKEVAGSDGDEWRTSEERAGPLLAFINTMLTRLVLPALQSRLRCCGVFAVRNLADDSSGNTCASDSNGCGTICAPSIVRNVARLLQRRVSSTPQAGEIDKTVVPHVAELILRCAAELRQVHTSTVQNGVVTLTGRWVTTSDLAAYLEECEADNSAVPLPEVSILSGWPAAASALLSVAVCTRLANSDGALPAVTLEVVADGCESGIRIPAVRLRPHFSSNATQVADDTGNVLFVTRGSGGRTRAKNALDHDVGAIGLPLDAEFFEFLCSEAAIRAIASHLELLGSGTDHRGPSSACYFKFSSPEAMQRLTAIRARLNAQVNASITQVAIWVADQNFDDKAMQSQCLARAVHQASDAWQANALLGNSVSASDAEIRAGEAVERVAKRQCAAATMEAAVALEKFAVEMRHVAEASELGIEFVASVAEEESSDRCFRISLQPPTVAALAAAAARD